ncbi:MAG: Lrp/AsnC family transcriptional regulator [Actinobacteria bacterium]|jgi:Lrp/AsnC family transcriptional regulator, regulator for asnA, asnC and gidA|nr:Lrp/AsnC family transcriptional regulator [Actinomycetota bacterium]NBP54163.1 Lrp/AsnC family transcriptional regulator [Actinomycetota bacterium]
MTDSSATSPQNGPVRLDATDQRIIEQLQADGRLPYTQLGTAVGLSEAAVRQRVQRLITTGVIQVAAVTNPLMVGLRRMALIGISTTGPTDGIADTLRGVDAIEYLVVTAGKFDFLAEVIVRDEAELLSVTNAIRAVRGVLATETFVYLDIAKQTYTYGVH